MRGFGLTALALMSDCRAVIECTCDRCGGPIAIGDKVVPIQDVLVHRSCFHASRGTISRFWRDKRTKARPAPAADERQLGLFGGGK